MRLEPPFRARRSPSRPSPSLVDHTLDRLTRCWSLHDRTRITRLRHQHRTQRYSALWERIQHVVTVT